MSRLLTVSATLVVTIAVFVGAAWALFTFTTESIDESMALHVATQHLLLQKRLDDLIVELRVTNQGITEINLKLVQIQADIRYLQKNR